MAYRIGGWESFALAQVGASAALLGLVFVGISINLRDIIGSGALVHRAAEAVILLGSVLVTATVVLVPGQRRDVLSTELILLAVALFAVVFYLQRDAVAQPDPGKPGPPADRSLSDASSVSVPPPWSRWPGSPWPRKRAAVCTGTRPRCSPPTSAR